MMEELTDEMSGQLVMMSRILLDNLDDASRDFCSKHKLRDPRYATLATLVMTESFLLRMLLRHFKPHEREAVADRITTGLKENLASSVGADVRRVPGRRRFDA